MKKLFGATLIALVSAFLVIGCVGNVEEKTEDVTNTKTSTETTNTETGETTNTETGETIGSTTNYLYVLLYTSKGKAQFYRQTEK